MPEFPEKSQDRTQWKHSGNAEARGSSITETPAATQLDLIKDWLARTDEDTDEVETEAAAPHQQGTPEQGPLLASAIQKRTRADMPAQVKTSHRKRLTESKPGTIIAASTKPAGSPRQAIVDHAQKSVPADAPLYLCVEKVARRYDASVASIWRWVKAGRFPAPRKIAGTMTRWAVADLDAYDRAMR